MKRFSNFKDIVSGNLTMYIILFHICVLENFLLDKVKI